MSAEEHKALIHRFAETVWNGKNVDALGDFHSAEFLQNGRRQTVEAFGQGLREWFAGPHAELQHTIEDMIAEGDKVAYRWTMRSTNPETGKPQVYRGITFMRIADGKIVEDWYSAQPLDE